MTGRIEPLRDWIPASGQVLLGRPTSPREDDGFRLSVVMASENCRLLVARRVVPELEDPTKSDASRLEPNERLRTIGFIYLGRRKCR